VLRTVLTRVRGRAIVIMDSLSQITDEDRGQIVVAASNGGLAAGHAARDYACACVVLNDAGIGRDDAGIAGIKALDPHGIPAVAVSHESAEISDGMDMWDNGIVSYVNAVAAAAGFAVGDAVRPSVLRFAEQA
jgi:hypothetical protein